MKEYNGVVGGDSHGKLVAEEELEVSPWILCVWLEDLVTVKLL
jgi:hypothetical protein